KASLFLVRCVHLRQVQRLDHVAQEVGLVILRQPLLQRWRQHQKLIRLVRSKRLRHGTLSQPSSGARNLQAYAASQHPFRRGGGGLLEQAPSDLDPAAYAVDDPLTWLEELHTAFQFEWAERVLAAELSDQRVVPPSTSDVRARFRAMYPGHEKLSDPQLLVNGLRQLAGSGRPRLRPVRRTGQRALLWAPIHVQDADLDLGGSYASDTERVVEAVARAMAALGAPAVRVEEVQDEIDRDTRLRPAGRQPLYVILSDAARTELISADGSRTQRATPRIDRVGVVGGSTYYAVGNTAGALEYPELLRLRIEWNELRATEELDAVRAAALPSIRAGRALQLAQVCEAIAERARTALPALPQVALVAELVEIEKNAS